MTTTGLMHVDSLTRKAVALGMILACGCGPSVSAKGPGPGPTDTTPHTPGPGAGVPGAHEVVVGEMCPDRVDGRPGLSTLAARRATGWTADTEDLEGLLARGTVRGFTVLGWSGKRAGTFTAAGPVATDTGPPVAIGAYAGQGICEKAPADCQAQTAGCGLAVARIPQAGEDDDPPLVEVGGACVSGAELVVDVDGHGGIAFPIAAFLDPVRAPEEEVVGDPSTKPGCTPTNFTLRNLVPAADPKAWRGMNLLGVADLDGDGHREIVLELLYGDKRTWAIYSAIELVQRLSLVAEVEPWGN